MERACPLLTSEWHSTHVQLLLPISMQPLVCMKLNYIWNCRFLQGPDTDQNTVQQIRDAITARKDITVQLLNYTKSGTHILSLTPVSFHFQFVCMNKNLIRSTSCPQCTRDIRLETTVRAWHPKIWAGKGLHLIWCQSLTINWMELWKSEYRCSNSCPVGSSIWF